MIYLIIAIVCGSLFSVLFKIYQRHGINVPQTIFFNYVTGAVVAWTSIALDIHNGGQAVSDFRLPISSLLLSALMGFLFSTGFMVMDRSTFRCGVALTTAAARASLILSVVFSWLILSQPAPPWIPVVLVLAAMLMIILPNEQQKHDWVANRSASDEIRNRKAALALFGVFLFYGISDFMLKFVQHNTTLGINYDTSLVNNRLSALTGMIFVTASLISFVTCIVRGSFRKHRIGWKAIGGGVLLGFANLSCTSCILKALDSMSTGLFYPLYNIGIVIISTVIGICFFKEKIKPVQIIGLIVAVAAIALFFS